MRYNFVYIVNFNFVKFITAFVLHALCFRNKRALSNSRQRLLFGGVVPGYLSWFQ